MSGQPLALAYHSHGEGSGLQGWRRGEDVIDSLPYIDLLSDDVQAKVKQMIAEETTRSAKTPADYLRELPAEPASRFEDHPALQQEMQRVARGQALDPIDITRYQLNPPPLDKRNDVNAWKSAVDNANSQLEHQLLRIVNHELLLKHGDKAWRAQTQMDESALKLAESELARAKAELESVNMERKLQQQAAGSELSKLEAAYLAQVRKNFDIERACDSIEEEVGSMEEALQAAIQADTQQAQPQAQGATHGSANGSSADGPVDAVMEDQEPHANGGPH